MEYLHTLFNSVDKYYHHLGEYKVREEPEYGFLQKELPDMFSKTPKDSKELFEEYMKKLIPYTTHWQSPYFFSFFP